MSLERIFMIGFIGVFAMIAAPFAVWLLYRVVYETKRRRAVRSSAAECGAEFRDYAVGKLKELEHFRMFASRGFWDPRPGKRIRNVLVRRSDDAVVSVFDYQWKGCSTGEDLDPRERRTVVHVKSDKLQMPRFDVRTNGLYLKLTSKLRSKVNVDASPQFARRYDLSCEDPDGIRAVFHPGVLELIAQHPTKLQFEGVDGGFIFHVVDRNFFGEGRVKPHKLAELMAFATELCGQMVRAPECTGPVDAEPVALGVGV